MRSRFIRQGRIDLIKCSSILSPNTYIMNKYIQNYSRLLRVGLLSVASLAVASTASAATFSEDFTTDPGNWSDGGTTNVSGGTANIGGGGYSKYAMAFDDSDGDTAGGVFSLSFDWAIDGSTFTDNGQHFYAGFGTSPGDGGSS
jgi:hypothetical protein